MYGDAADNSPTTEDEESSAVSSNQRKKYNVNAQHNEELNVADRVQITIPVNETNVREINTTSVGTSDKNQPKDTTTAVKLFSNAEEMNRSTVQNKSEVGAEQGPKEVIEQKRKEQTAHVKPTILQAPLPPNYSQRACAQEKDHLSIACHLFPRLSESNLQFHDISWNYEQFPDGARNAILRKRMVKVCVLLKIHSIRYERRPTVAVNRIFEVNMCLVDGRPRAENQIVSNLYTATVSAQNNRTRFLSKSLLSVMIRSNYAQPEVQLRIALKLRDTTATIQPNDSSKASATLTDLGAVELALLDETQNAVWRKPNQPRSHLFGNAGNEFQMNFELCEFATRQAQIQADYLPDVLICDESWIGMLACYRQMTCEILAHHRENQPHSTTINDIVLATFPKILERRTLVDAFIKFLVKERMLTSSGNLGTGSQLISAQNVQKFCQLYCTYMVPFVKSAEVHRDPTIVQRLIDTMLNAGSDSNMPFTMLAAQRCTPLSPTDYSLQLASSHALD